MMNVNVWMADVELRCDVQSEITPQDSVSQASSRKSGASKHNSSTTSAARINEAIRMAELSVRAKSLEAQQQLELHKLQLKQQEERLRLETEIARSTAKKEILSTLQSEVSIKSGAKSQSSRVTRDRFSDSQRALLKDPKTSPKVTLPPTTPSYRMTLPRTPIMTDSPRVERNLNNFVTVNKPVTDFMLDLQSQQNSLNIQQNEILKGFSEQQQKSNLPKPDVPVFDGDPMEYDNFMRAFEHIIETKVKSEVERLYYLEQYTSGDVKQLVKSCQHIEHGYEEAKMLLKKRYGNPYKIASAYMEKLTKWPELKSEDNSALHKLSIFLLCCKNVMKGNVYLNKFENVDNMQQIVQKLPFGMRCRWRRQVDEIMESKHRVVTFCDLVDFVEKEPRIATHPIFGDVTSGAKKQNPVKVERKKKCSFVATMEKPKAKICQYCPNRTDHMLEECDVLKRKPYSKRRWRQIQYLTDIFWKRWTREYIPMLQERQKWLQPKRNVELNDLVLLVDHSSSRNMWPMGRIIAVHPDKSGLVRTVKVKTKLNVLERPVNKLVLLLEADKQTEI